MLLLELIRNGAETKAGIDALSSEVSPPCTALLLFHSCGLTGIRNSTLQSNQPALLLLPFAPARFIQFGSGVVYSFMPEAIKHATQAATLCP